MCLCARLICFCWASSLARVCALACWCDGRAHAYLLVQVGFASASSCTYSCPVCLQAARGLHHASAFANAPPFCVLSVAQIWRSCVQLLERARHARSLSVSLSAHGRCAAAGFCSELQRDLYTTQVYDCCGARCCDIGSVLMPKLPLRFGLYTSGLRSRSRTSPPSWRSNRGSCRWGRTQARRSGSASSSTS